MARGVKDLALSLLYTDPIPGPGTSLCPGQSQKQTNKHGVSLWFSVVTAVALITAMAWV